LAQIRTVINNIYAPSYTLANHTDHKLKELVTLKHEFKVIISTNCAEKIHNLHVNPEHKFLTFVVKELYDSIPINDTLNITTKIL
jgi:hypothetical protein